MDRFWLVEIHARAPEIKNIHRDQVEPLTDLAEERDVHAGNIMRVIGFPIEVFYYPSRETAKVWQRNKQPAPIIEARNMLLNHGSRVRKVLDKSCRIYNIEFLFGAERQEIGLDRFNRALRDPIDPYHTPEYLIDNYKI